jgi:hypothetical protein
MTIRPKPPSPSQSSTTEITTEEVRMMIMVRPRVGIDMKKVI